MRRGKCTEHPSASLLGDAHYPRVIEVKFFLQPTRPIVEPAQQFFNRRSRVLSRSLCTCVSESALAQIRTSISAGSTSASTSPVGRIPMPANPHHAWHRKRAPSRNRVPPRPNDPKQAIRCAAVPRDHACEVAIRRRSHAIQHRSRWTFGRAGPSTLWRSSFIVSALTFMRESLTGLRLRRESIKFERTSIHSMQVGACAPGVHCAAPAKLVAADPIRWPVDPWPADGCRILVVRRRTRHDKS